MVEVTFSKNIINNFTFCKKCIR